MDNNTILSPEDFEMLQEFIDSYTDILLLQYTLIAVTALSLYEAILAIPKEVQYIYSKKFGLTSLLYVLSRYCVIGIFLAEVIINFIETYDSNFSGFGPAAQVLPPLLSIGALIGIQGLWGTRLYAVSSGKKTWTAVLLLIFLLTVGTSVASSITVYELDSSSQLNIVNKALSTLQNSLVTSYDSLVFFGTVYYTFGVWRLQRKTSLNASNSIPILLLGQGLFRYVFVVLFNIATIVLDLVPISVEKSSLGGYLQDCLSAILLCRLTLELREKNEKKIDEVKLPTLAWSVRSIREAGRYIHETLVAEGREFFIDEEVDPTSEDDTNIIEVSSSASEGQSMV